ncbi:hypothetical protein DFR24_0452 [Panacagrimonas perspica]|uniref:Uncharacterized protein n=1 Tax=Panacagrimonas perspica TaxID=381431 RepID=A0A4R7PAL0_9GAMM|nr:hypothetical protein [Panacagrimonas perspica]TDU31093.1 hypothetical protein DFR24_0452 [Panacagrimonas perspica]THD01767.1 hypothetical protein B1810_17305 [Panacagrimonas perspica]
MKTFKSFALSACTAASTLMFVALSTPTQAWAIQRNGPVFNGPVLNGPIVQGPVVQGPVLQGPVIQGPVLQGPIVQGPLLQGPTARGAHLGKFVAVTLPGGERIPVH